MFFIACWRLKLKTIFYNGFFICFRIKVYEKDYLSPRVKYLFRCVKTRFSWVNSVWSNRSTTRPSPSIRIAENNLGSYSSAIFELLPEGTRKRDVVPLTSYPDRAMTWSYAKESVWNHSKVGTLVVHVFIQKQMTVSTCKLCYSIMQTVYFGLILQPMCNPVAATSG
jgi:hypothetical protein